MDGLRGSSEGFGLFIDATGPISFIFAITIAMLCLYDFGWRKTLGLLIVTMIAGWIWSIVGALIGAIIGQVPLWFAGTVLVYVAAIALFLQFSWFGIFFGK
jgi:hypothetical protein